MSHKISRRRFLGEASCTAVGSASLFSTLMNLRMTNSAAAEAITSTPSISATNLANSNDYKALVCIFLAGGNDSFNMLVPRGNEEYTEYATIRADLALSQGDLIPINVTNGNGKAFGVHPAMPEV
ncbi:MAG: twin-arginine translocation signal domain-containing protein, partial [Chloroflexota bacterium]